MHGAEGEPRRQPVAHEVPRLLRFDVILLTPFGRELARLDTARLAAARGVREGQGRVAHASSCAHDAEELKQRRQMLLAVEPVGWTVRQLHVQGELGLLPHPLFHVCLDPFASFDGESGQPRVELVCGEEGAVLGKTPHVLPRAPLAEIVGVVQDTRAALSAE